MYESYIKKFKLVKVDAISGKFSTIYSILVDGEVFTSLDKFIEINKYLFINETKEIVKRLSSIGNKTGARLQYFKVNEGIPGDGVCALYDISESKLRLYCIRFGTQIVVVGSGGLKSKEDDKLKNENYFLRWLSSAIKMKLIDKEMWFSKDFLQFEGNLEFELNNE